MFHKLLKGDLLFSALPCSCRTAFLVMLVAGAGSPTLAVTYNVTIPSNQYGNLNQHDMHVYPTMACGPASSANSLDYLQNAFPDIYGTSLVPTPGYNGLITVGDTLAGPSYMQTDSVNGTWHDNLIVGMKNYIEGRVSGETSYSAEDYWSWAHQTQPNWAQTMTPQWNFIYQQLTNDANVQILLTYNAGGGHFVTVNGLNWNDADGDGVIDSSEGAQLSFVNPWTGTVGTAQVWQTSLNGRIETDYSSSWISMVYAMNVKSVGPVTGSWSSAISGNWSQTTKWVGAQVPGSAGDTASFGNVAGAGATTTVTLNGSRTLSGLRTSLQIDMRA
jgi:hypothetical protein